jgi:protein-tyrosine phosphatase
LSELTADDHARLAPLGIRHVYDLRRASEVEAAPTNWAGRGRRCCCIGRCSWMRPGPACSTASPRTRRRGTTRGCRARSWRSYARLVSEAGALAIYREMFAHLAEPEAAPALFHGSAGKDRTGVTCALIPRH